MRRSMLVRALGLGLVALLVLPATGFAGATGLGKSIAGKPLYAPTVGIDTIWVIVAAWLVMFVPAGFAFLEIGFSRAKDAGTIVAKILTGYSPLPDAPMSAELAATTKEAFTS